MDRRATVYTRSPDKLYFWASPNEIDLMRRNGVEVFMVPPDLETQSLRTRVRVPNTPVTLTELGLLGVILDFPAMMNPSRGELET